MQIHLSDVLSQENRTKSYTAEYGVDTYEMYGVSYPMIRKEPVTLTISHKEKKKLAIHVTGEMVFEIPCDRCLKPVEVPVSFDSDLEVDMALTPEERIQNLEEAAYIHGYTLDVDELVKGELFVHMPMKVLCGEDCKGTVEEHGTQPGTCDCNDAVLDPRMAVIRDIFQKANQKGDKEV
jgi:uncharacterized protein